MATRMRTALRCAAAALALLAAGCASVNPDYDANRTHHTPSGFRNPYAPLDGGGGFWEYQWERFTHGLAQQDAGKVPVVALDPELLRAPDRGVRATWIGQSTVLLQLGPVNVLTDPMFSRRASPVQWLGPERAVALPIEPGQLPHIDIVLVSNNAYDHLDADSVKALAAQPGPPPVFVVPLGLERWFAAQGIANVRRLDWWDHLRIGDVEIVLTPAQHSSRRGLFDHDATLWGGFVVRRAGFTAWFSGDTGYAPELFDDIGSRFARDYGRIDFAMIPVGCYLPRWFLRETDVDPAEAVRIHRDVHARLSLGVHWGTFRLCEEPVEQPLVDLPAARRALGVRDDEFVLFAIGESRRLR